jgi:hypothetical protein
MAIKEGRLSRWSQLKSKGGASADENRIAKESIAIKREPDNNLANTGIQKFDKLTIEEGFPENRYKLLVAPEMSPLAGYKDTDWFFEAPPEEALAMLNGDIAHEPAGDFPSVEVLNDGDELERELTADEVETVAALQPVDTLTADADFGPFMSRKVPKFIRLKALKVLYQTHPILGFHDEINEYDPDYNVIDTLINAATQTSYKISQGQEEALEKEAGGDGAISEISDSEAQLKQPNLIANENTKGEVSDELDIEALFLRDVRKPDDKENIQYLTIKVGD